MIIWPWADRYLTRSWSLSDHELILSDHELIVNWLWAGCALTVIWPWTDRYLNMSWSLSDHELIVNWTWAGRDLTMSWTLSDHGLIFSWPWTGCGLTVSLPTVWNKYRDIQPLTVCSRIKVRRRYRFFPPSCSLDDIITQNTTIWTIKLEENYNFINLFAARIKLCTQAALRNVALLQTKGLRLFRYLSFKINR